MLKEAKRILKSDGRRKTKWTLVLITFGAPRIARKRTLIVAQRLQKVGADMYLLAIGKRAFNSYETLKSIVRPFESAGRKIVQRLFLFRGPQDRADFVMTKAVLKIGKSVPFQDNLRCTCPERGHWKIRILRWWIHVCNVTVFYVDVLNRSRL